MQPTSGPPRLRPWSRVWRYLLAVAVGLVIWFLIAIDMLVLADPDTRLEDLPVEVVGPLFLAVVLDLVLGAVALTLLPLRRRHPVAVACATAALTSVSGAAVGAATLAAVSMSTWRRWRDVAVTGVAWALATAVYEGVYRPGLPVAAPEGAVTVASTLVAVAVFAACVATGFYVGARRELFASLQERLATAERQRALEAGAARHAERTRIAREMHDVLAHRISLVAMHAGALGYRTDLSREETAQAATVIQENAHRALVELREVLGVLRADDGVRPGPADDVGQGRAPGPGAPAPELTSEVMAEPPQPTLAGLGELVAEVGTAGTAVMLSDTLPPEPGPPATASRTAYRIVQECLTNARKHAPGVPVRVELSGAPDLGLRVRVSNPLPARPVTGAHSGGMGLTGLQERAALAGGHLTHDAGPDGGFVVEAWLPWERR